MSQTNSKGQTYEQWYKSMNKLLRVQCGLGFDDIEDCNSYQVWEDDGGFNELLDEACQYSEELEKLRDILEI